MRCLKRYLAREVYRALRADLEGTARCLTIHRDTTPYTASAWPEGAVHAVEHGALRHPVLRDARPPWRTARVLQRRPPGARDPTGRPRRGGAATELADERSLPRCAFRELRDPPGHRRRDAAVHRRADRGETGW